MDLTFFQDPRTWVDLALVSFVVYQLLSSIKGTRTVQILIMMLLLLAAYISSNERFLDLPTFRWIMDKFWSVIFLVIVVIYQDDIRRSLSRYRLFSDIFRSRGTSFGIEEHIVKACRDLSEKRIGALVAVERLADLSGYCADSGIPMDAKVSQELLFALFLDNHENPTHDGAVLISKDRIVAAGVVLPLTTRELSDSSLGTRHRAAIGLSEQVDAVVVVVSEETGRISVAEHGELHRNLTLEELRYRLQDHRGRTSSTGSLESQG